MLSVAIDLCAACASQVAVSLRQPRQSSARALPLSHLQFWSRKRTCCRQSSEFSGQQTHVLEW